jgi:RNase P subunit RPR2
LTAPVPIPCTKCGAVLAHADGGKVRVSAAAVAVGKVVLVCCRCGRFRVWRPAQEKVDRPVAVRQDGSG